METLNLRIAKIIKEKNLTHDEFSKVVGVSRSYVTSIVSTNKKPSIEILIGIACHYRDINEHWLLTGEGEMYRRSGTTPSIEDIPEWLREWWARADERERNWLEVELKRL